jgi:hypothetical protein
MKSRARDSGGRGGDTGLEPASHHRLEPAWRLDWASVYEMVVLVRFESNYSLKLIKIYIDKCCLLS